jgi:hypothetical protein
MKLAMMGQSHFGDQELRKSDKIVFFFQFQAITLNSQTIQTMQLIWSLVWRSSWERKKNDATLQNFIYKHTVDLGNVQRNKKKGEFTGCKGSLN